MFFIMCAFSFSLSLDYIPSVSARISVFLNTSQKLFLQLGEILLDRKKCSLIPVMHVPHLQGKHLSTSNIKTKNRVKIKFIQSFLGFLVYSLNMKHEVCVYFVALV